jgi:hypothetical protein
MKLFIRYEFIVVFSFSSKWIFILSAFAFLSPILTKGQNDSLKIYIDFITQVKNEKVEQELFYSTKNDFQADIKIQCFRINSKDSILVYKITKKNVRFCKGSRKIRLDLKRRDAGTWVNPDIESIIKNTNYLPTGSYLITVSGLSSENPFQYSFERFVDSTVSNQSHLREDLNTVYSEPASLQRTCKICEVSFVL